MSSTAPLSIFDQIEAWLRRRPDVRYVRSQNMGDSIRIEAQDNQGFSVELCEYEPPWWTINVGEHGIHIHAADQEEAEMWLHLLLSDACRVEITLGLISMRGIIKEWQEKSWKTVYTYRAFMPRFWKDRGRMVLSNRIVLFGDDDEADKRS